MTTNDLAAVLNAMQRRAALLESATTPDTCLHPAARLYAWWARDDTAPDGRVLCVGCMACGAVLQGAAEPLDDDKLQSAEEALQNG